jgi:hypothetical protein
MNVYVALFILGATQPSLAGTCLQPDFRQQRPEYAQHDFGVRPQSNRTTISHKMSIDAKSSTILRQIRTTNVPNQR